MVAPANQIARPPTPRMPSTSAAEESPTCMKFWGATCRPCYAYQAVQQHGRRQLLDVFLGVDGDEESSHSYQVATSFRLSY